MPNPGPPLFLFLLQHSLYPLLFVIGYDFAPMSGIIIPVMEKEE